MTSAGIREYGRRIVALAMLVGGLALLNSSVAAGSGLIALAIVLYWAIPAVARPEGSLGFSPMTAVIMPDLLGFLLTSFFLVLPVWMAAEDPDHWGLVHPAIMMTGPMALISLLILVSAANHAVYALAIGERTLAVVTAFSERTIPYEDIDWVEPWRRGLPRFVRALAPLLILTGKYTAAGSLMLARDTTGIRLRLKAGGVVVVELEGFERAHKKLLAMLRRHRIRFGAPVSPSA